MNTSDQASDDLSDDAESESRDDIHEYWIHLLQVIPSGLIDIRPNTDKEFGRITLRQADGCELSYLRISFRNGYLSLFPENFVAQAQKAMGDGYTHTTTILFDEDILTWTEWRMENRIYEWKDDRGFRSADSNRRMWVRSDYCAEWRNVQHFGVIHWDTKAS